MKLLIVTGHDGQLPYADLSARSWDEYARHRGYGFHLYRFTPEGAGRGHPAWQKLPLLRGLIASRAAPWIMWVDADTVVTNHRIAVEKLTNVGVTDDWLIVSRDWGAGEESPYSAGVMLWRSCPQALAFLEEACERGKFRNMPLWDQSELQENGIPENGISILPRRVLQSVPMDGCPEPWQPGDFVAHATGREQRDKRAVMETCERLALKG